MPAHPITASNSGTEPIWRTVVEIALPATTDRTEQAVQQVMTAVKILQLSSARLVQLTEALCNAISQNERLQPQLPLQITVSIAALADRDAACCWGFFVIARTADRSAAPAGPAHHAIELFLYQDRA